MTLEELDKYRKKQNRFLNNFANISLAPSGLSTDDINELYCILNIDAYKTSVKKPNMTIADVGCYAGTSTVLFASLIKEMGGKVYAIDNFTGSPKSDLNFSHTYLNIRKILEKHLEEFGLEKEVQIIQQNSIEASNQYPDNFFDIVFLDADHRYEAIKEDIKIWLPKVKKDGNGLIMGHDCELLAQNFEDLFNKVKDNDMSHLHLGVIKALFEEIPDAQHTDTGVIWFKKIRTGV